ncbi:hypothetical protein ABC304_03665 [Microbacterium sp. 1P10UB]|uniref:hypothetical protein n=1 Tax=unclassified Microbacterium TaxID=2609290 RepID=UPI0039A1E7C1
MDDALIKWHLSAVRMLVLDIIARQPGVALEAIVAEWIAQQPAMSPRHRAAMPRMTGEILWRLENLGWVEKRHGLFRLTDLGARARTVAHLDR